MKISHIYGKRVRGAKEGYVISVNADGRKLILVCADENEREFAVPVEKAELGGSEVNTYETCAVPKGRALRLGKAAFDENGGFLGTLEDVTLVGGRLKTAKIGKKNYPWEGITAGDVIIVRSLPRLKKDVIKDGQTLFKRGVAVTDDVLSDAAAAGEYVQTVLKSL